MRDSILKFILRVLFDHRKFGGVRRALLKDILVRARGAFVSNHHIMESIESSLAAGPWRVEPVALLIDGHEVSPEAYIARPEGSWSIESGRASRYWHKMRYELTHELMREVDDKIDCAWPNWHMCNCDLEIASLQTGLDLYTHHHRIRDLLRLQSPARPSSRITSDPLSDMRSREFEFVLSLFDSAIARLS